MTPKRKTPVRLRTRINWDADSGPWLRAMQAKLRRGEFGPFQTWPQFCKHAIIRATLPDSASGGTVPIEVAMQLSPAAHTMLANLTITKKEKPRG